MLILAADYAEILWGIPLETLGSTIDELLSYFSKAVPFLFSWIILTPIAIIVGGWFLRSLVPMALPQGERILFSIKIPPMLDINAKDTEVILGFTAFLFTFLLVGVSLGPHGYVFFKYSFGIDPGHWNSLCILSALINVAWTFGTYVAFHFGSIFPAYNKTRDDILDRVAIGRGKATGGDQNADE